MTDTTIADLLHVIVPALDSRPLGVTMAATTIADLVHVIVPALDSRSLGVIDDRHYNSRLSTCKKSLYWIPDHWAACGTPTASSTCEWSSYDRTWFSGPCKQLIFIWIKCMYSRHRDFSPPYPSIPAYGVTSLFDPTRQIHERLTLLRVVAV
jgi:hypothetical protein